MRLLGFLSALLVCTSCSKYELTEVNLEEDQVAVLSAYFIVGSVPQISVYKTYRRGDTPQQMEITEIKLYRNDSLIVKDETGSLKNYPEAEVQYGKQYRIEVKVADGTLLSGNVEVANQLIIERLSRDTVVEKDGSSSLLYTYLFDINNPQIDQVPLFYHAGFIDSLFRPDSSYYDRVFKGEWTGVVPDPVFNDDNLAFLDGNFKGTLVFKAPFKTLVGHKFKEAVHFFSLMSPIIIQHYRLTQDLDVDLENYTHLPAVVTNVEGGAGIITEYTTYVMN